MTELKIDTDRALALLKKRGVAWPLVILLLGGGGGTWATFCSQIEIAVQIKVPTNEFLKFVPADAAPGAPGLPGAGP